LCLSTLEKSCEISLLLQQIKASKGGVKGWKWSQCRSNKQHAENERKLEKNIMNYLYDNFYILSYKYDWNRVMRNHD
jgi:hypothetical protein